MLTSERAKLCVCNLLKLLLQTYRQIRYPAGNCITSMELLLALTVDASALAATHSFLQATNTFRVDSERGRRCTPAQLSIHIVWRSAALFTFLYFPPRRSARSGKPPAVQSLAFSSSFTVSARSFSLNIQRISPTAGRLKTTGKWTLLFLFCAREFASTVYVFYLPCYYFSVFLHSFYLSLSFSHSFSLSIFTLLFLILFLSFLA